MAENVLARYFIAKCDTFENLSKCQETRVWAVPKHEKEEQPREALLVAFNTGPVVLLFSVNGSKGWEGYARLVTAPSDVSVTRNGMGEWYTFEVEWVVTFTDRFRNGLPFAKTESFMLGDGESLKSINLARNWEEVELSIGNCYNSFIYFIILLHSVICIHHHRRKLLTCSQKCQWCTTVLCAYVHHSMLPNFVQFDNIYYPFIFRGRNLRFVGCRIRTL